MFELSFLDNPGITWIVRVLITLILCALIINRIMKAASDWATSKSVWGIIDEIVQTLLMIVVIIIFSFPLSKIIAFFVLVWWAFYDYFLVHILRFLGFPV